MANQIQTVTAQEINSVGNGSVYYNGKLFREYGTGQYHEVGNPNNLIDGPRSTRNQNNQDIPDNQSTTDIIVLKAALCSGPVYRINPDGPQNIEIDEDSIDDLIDLDNTGDLDTTKYVVDYRTGTVNQSALRLFDDEVPVERPFDNRIPLKKGTHSTKSAVTLKATTPLSWDALKFNFIISSLYRLDDSGNYHARSLRVRITVYDRAGTNILVQRELKRTGKVTADYRISEVLAIPENLRSTAGYKFTVEKISDESSDENIRDDIDIESWTEIEKAPFSYPGVAVIGHALKATDKYAGTSPNFTSIVKGDIIKVPSNYNQPVIARPGNTTEIDWRELETNIDERATQGIVLENSTTILKDDEARYPKLYDGVFDGTTKYAWSENPAWILYHLLTDERHGLGISESYIDIYSFYAAGQWYDDVNPLTGRFNASIETWADGSNQYKPRGKYTSNRETLVGSPNTVKVTERRCVVGLTIGTNEKAIDVIRRLASSVYAVINFNGSKIKINVDKPQETPTMLFNDTNIEEGSFSITGVAEKEIISTVEASYTNRLNSFKKDIIAVDATERNDGSEFVTFDKKEAITLFGVNRRSQALRFAQFQLASSTYSRRRIGFATSTEGLDLSLNDLIAVSSSDSGIKYGVGGRVESNTASTITLSHYSTPEITSSLYSSNTSPWVLRVASANTNVIDTYILSNTIVTSDTSNAVGVDTITVTPVSKFSETSNSYESTFTIEVNKDDVWTLGQANTTAGISRLQSDKLFKITNIINNEDRSVSVSAEEYINDIYTDSEAFIDSRPIVFERPRSSFTPPPTPKLSLEPLEKINEDGSIRLDIVVNADTNRTFYTEPFTTEYKIAYPISADRVSDIHVNTDNVILTTDHAHSSSNTYILDGKNGFRSEIGRIPLICNASSVVTDPNNSLGAIKLDILEDTSFNDGASNRVLRVGGQVTIPVEEKTTTDNFILNRKSVVSTISRTITRITDGNIYINEEDENGVRLSNILPEAPFYVSIWQNVNDVNHKRLFVPGFRDTIVKEGEFSGTNEVTIDLGTVPKDKRFVELTVDGVEKSQADFTLDLANVSYTPDVGDNKYRVTADVYKTPIYEMNDPVVLETGEQFTVSGASYLPSSSITNANFTSNNLYEIQLNKAPSSNVNNLTLVNISKNPAGFITSNTMENVTFEYNTSLFPGAFTLPNVYKLQNDAIFETLALQNRTITDVPKGVVSVAARNKNGSGKLSPYVTTSIETGNIQIPRVTDLELVESLYREQTGGVSVRITASFTPVDDARVTEYMLTYRLTQVEMVGSNDGGTPQLEWNTVMIPAGQVGDDGKIRYSIFGINRGTVNRNNEIIVRVTAMNKKISGARAQVRRTIIGKTSPPNNILDFTGSQKDESINFQWRYVLASTGDLADIDLKEVVIKRLPGSASATLENFVKAEDFVVVSAGSGRKSAPTQGYGLYTYLARTRDTSGNYSESIVATEITTTITDVNETIYSYSEDNPTSVDRNAGESSYPSFNNTVTNGIATLPGATPADNANASSSGWTTETDTTDIRAAGDAVYTTKIRDLGQELIADISIRLDDERSVVTGYNDQYNVILTGVSDATPAGDYGAGGQAATFGAWDSPGTVPTRSATDLNTRTTDGIYPFAPSTPNSGYAHEGTVAVYTVGTTQYQLVAAGAVVGTGRKAVRSRSLPSGSWGSWTVNPGSEYYVSDVNVDTNIPKLVNSTTANNIPTLSGSQSDAVGILWRQSSTRQRYYVGHFGNRYFERTITPDTTPPPVTPVAGSNVFTDRTAVGNQGLGAYLNSQTGLSFSSTNRTLISGGATGNVYAIRNPGQHNNDTANTGAIALIAGVINNNTIALGETYYANGQPTHSNNFANSSPASYQLINLTQYSDTGPAQTFVGDIGAVSGSLSIRKARTNPYFANGDANVAAFIGGNVNDGFEPYSPGFTSFRYFQIKLEIDNQHPNDYDLILDEFNYTVNKQKVEKTYRVEFSGSETTIDITELNLLTTPSVTVSPVSSVQLIPVISAVTRTSVTFNLFRADNNNQFTSTITVGVFVNGV